MNRGTKLIAALTLAIAIFTLGAFPYPLYAQDTNQYDSCLQSEATNLISRLAREQNTSTNNIQLTDAQLDSITATCRQRFPNESGNATTGNDSSRLSTSSSPSAAVSSAPSSSTNSSSSNPSARPQEDVNACITRQSATAGSGNRDQFRVRAFCQSQQYTVPTRYESCAMTGYDRFIRLSENVDPNQVVPQSERDRITTECAQAETAGTNTSNSSQSTSNSSSPSASNGLQPLQFNGDPNRKYVGTFTGPSTENLQSYYSNPLLLLRDRQTAFSVLVRFFLGLIGVVALLYLVFNGYRYAMARGEDAQISQAKKGILYAVIGLIIVLAAYTIVATVLNFGATPAPPNVGIGVGISL
ncbi:MAG: hypothetical protein HY817_05195 [Candidatus Abawacabacteria bacterium]|nr:hypothetical protein [Candidatus Abawacabacteria bacterium]